MSKSTSRKPTTTDCKAQKPFNVIHTNLSGKFTMPSLAKSKYFLPFLDEKTRYIWIRFTKRKTNVPQLIKEFILEIRTQFGVDIKFFHSDGGGEFIGTKTAKVFKLTGTKHRVSPPHHHKSNGRIKQYIRTIITDARTILTDDDQLFLWPEAIAHSAYIKNIKPHRGLINNTTPHEALFRTKPSIGYLRPYMSDYYLHIPKEARQPGTKFHDRAERAKLVGYNSPSIMRLYVPSRHVVTTATLSHVRFVTAANKVHWDLTEPSCDEPSHTERINQRHTVPDLTPETFDEERQTTESVSDRLNQSVSLKQSESSAVELDRLSSPRRDRLTSPARPTSSPTQIPSPCRTVGRPRCTVPLGIEHPPSPGTTRSGRFYLAKTANETLNDPTSDVEPVDAIAMIAIDNDIPSTLQQALNSIEATHWKRAVHDELTALTSKHVWIETPTPKGKPIVTPRWVFAKKHDAQGHLVRHKARLVARGFTQIHGLNYDETYSPVARYDSLRIIARLAALRGWKIHQMDVETAYLYSNLRHEVFMHCPEGYEPTTSDHPVVLRLQKALYGLKQSGREWFGTLKRTMCDMNMTPLPSDPCVFRRKDLIVGVYVDDIVITGEDQEIHSFKDMLLTKYKCKDLGICWYLLGLEITQTDKSIIIS